MPLRVSQQTNTGDHHRRGDNAAQGQEYELSMNGGALSFEAFIRFNLTSIEPISTETIILHQQRVDAPKSHLRTSRNTKPCGHSTVKGVVPLSCTPTMESGPENSVFLPDNELRLPTLTSARDARDGREDISNKSSSQTSILHLITERV